jgi:hypothetical protein
MGVVRPPQGQNGKKKIGEFGPLGWPTHPQTGRHGGGRTTLVALRGDVAIPQGQNRFCFFFVKGWPTTPMVAKLGGSATPLFFYFFNFFIFLFFN